MTTLETLLATTHATLDAETERDPVPAAIARRASGGSWLFAPDLYECRACGKRFTVMRVQETP